MHGCSPVQCGFTVHCHRGPTLGQTAVRPTPALCPVSGLFENLTMRGWRLQRGNVLLLGGQVKGGHGVGGEAGSEGDDGHGDGDLQGRDHGRHGKRALALVSLRKRNQQAAKPAARATGVRQVAGNAGAGVQTTALQRTWSPPGEGGGSWLLGGGIGAVAGPDGGCPDGALGAAPSLGGKWGGEGLGGGGMLVGGGIPVGAGGSEGLGGGSGDGLGDGGVDGKGGEGGGLGGSTYCTTTTSWLCRLDSWQ